MTQNIKVIPSGAEELRTYPHHKLFLEQAWWYAFVITILKRLKQEDCPSTRLSRAIKYQTNKINQTENKAIRGKRKLLVTLPKGTHITTYLMTETYFSTPLFCNLR